MQIRLLKTEDGGWRMEFETDNPESGFIEGLLSFIQQTGAWSKDSSSLRAWAKLHRQFYGHRFIANNVHLQGFDELIKEGLILEADSEEEYNKLMAEEVARGKRR